MSNFAMTTAGFVISAASERSRYWGFSLIDRFITSSYPSNVLPKTFPLKPNSICASSLPSSSARGDSASSRVVQNPMKSFHSNFVAQAVSLSLVRNIFYTGSWNWPYKTLDRSMEDVYLPEIEPLNTSDSVSSETPASETAFSLNPGILASSVFTSILVTYSVMIAEWWQFKHTVGDRISEAFASFVMVEIVNNVAKPISVTVEKFSSLNYNLQLFDKFFGRSKTISDVNSSAAVIESEDQNDVNTVDQDKSLLFPGFSFSAAGLLFPYHLGVSQCLMDNGILKDNTPLAGSSAGAIVCATISSGVGMYQALDATKELAKDCRANGTAFRLGFVLRNFLEDFLPANAHELSSGRIRVAVTQVFQSPRGLLVDNFESREDLINSLITSSFVPGYLAPSPVTRFRNKICIDGGLSNFMPPTAANQTVRVCAFPASSFGLKGIGISPDLNPQNASSMKQLFTWALQPAEDGILDDLFERGYNDCLAWIREQSGRDKLII